MGGGSTTKSPYDTVVMLSCYAVVVVVVVRDNVMGAVMGKIWVEKNPRYRHEYRFKRDF